jgi:hypothetical protein
MPLEKVLQKLRMQIKELSAVLENFSVESVQPSVKDCEQLQRQLNDFLEQLAVYKYNKTDKELSPTFNIHARVSEATREPVAPAAEAATQPVPPPAPAPARTEGKDGGVNGGRTEPKMPKSLVIGVNDKFRFINELFMQNAPEYHIALQQINNLNSWPEADFYLNSLKGLYGWKDNNEAVKQFYSLVKKRYA